MHTPAIRKPTCAEDTATKAKPVAISTDVMRPLYLRPNLSMMSPDAQNKDASATAATESSWQQNSRSAHDVRGRANASATTAATTQTARTSPISSFVIPSESPANGNTSDRASRKNVKKAQNTPTDANSLRNSTATRQALNGTTGAGGELVHVGLAATCAGGDVVVDVVAVVVVVVVVVVAASGGTTTRRPTVQFG